MNLGAYKFCLMFCKYLDFIFLVTTFYRLVGERKTFRKHLMCILKNEAAYYSETPKCQFCLDLKI
jgi:hypothetical protein